ncbi:MAG: hypothetical protein AAFR68_19810 [Pseudomonadota bacterium]
MLTFGMPQLALDTDSVVAAVPEAAVVLCTRTDTVVTANDAASRLLGFDPASPPKFSSFLTTQVHQFLVFLDELDTRGQAWTREIELARTDGKSL